MNFTTEKTGKAIQIQSVSYDSSANQFTIYVQNVGDSALALSGTNSVFINGAGKDGTWTLSDLPKGDTTQITVDTGLSTGVQSVTIKVTTTDGTFSQITQQFTIP